MRLSPAVRRLIKEHGVDVTQLKGTGSNGRVTKKDVEDYISGAPADGARVRLDAIHPAPEGQVDGVVERLLHAPTQSRARAPRSTRAAPTRASASDVAVAKKL